MDLEALRTNARIVRDLTANGGASPIVMAVVKADAYGHGAVRAAKAFAEAGIERFGVTSLDEALELTDAGLDSLRTPILIFATLTSRDDAEAAAARGLHVTVSTEADLARYIEAWRECGVGSSPNFHLKVDTGMGRLGLVPREAMEVARSLKTRHGLTDWAGIYTHFACASENDLAPARKQLQLFQQFCSDFLSEGIGHGLRHCANSAAMIRMPESRLDMVRPGTILYGQAPANVDLPAGIRADSWSAEAAVLLVKELPTGATIGYGSEFTTRSPTTVAVLPIGFADGFAVAPESLYKGLRGVRRVIRSLGPRGRSAFVRFGHAAAPVLGRVAMQMIVVDVTHITPAVQQGDVANVPMRRLSASARLPRVYGGGEADAAL